MVIIDRIDRIPWLRHGTSLPDPAALPLPFPVQSLLTRTAGILSCGAPETPERVALAVEESKRREKHVDDLERELADEMAQWRAAGGEG